MKNKKKSNFRIECLSDREVKKKQLYLMLDSLYEEPGFLMEVLILTWKNAKLVFNTPYLITKHLLWPIAIGLLIIFINLSNYNGYIQMQNGFHTNAHKIDFLPKCQTDNCITLAYGVLGNSDEK